MFRNILQLYLLILQKKVTQNVLFNISYLILITENLLLKISH